MTTFHAKSMFYGEVTEGVLGLVAAEGEAGEGARLELQRSTSFDAQDVELGQDTYCLSLHTGASVYGGVSRWVLTAGRLMLELSAQASRALGLDGDLTIEFDAQVTSDVREWLPKILGTSDTNALDDQ